MVKYKFSLGIHDKDGGLLAKRVLFSEEWTMVDCGISLFPMRYRPFDPKIKEEICEVLEGHIADSITQELINDLITSVDEGWVE